MENQLDNKALRNKIMKGLRLAIKKLIEKSKKENEKLIFYRDGKVVKVNAKDL